jgi:trigger factor
MEIAVKNVLDDKLRKDFQLNIPAQLINQKINEYLTQIQPEFSMEGFEKGQVPIATIKEKHGKSIMAEQSDILISDAIGKIVNDNNYKIASYPKIEFKTFEEGKDLNLVASFEIFPSMPEVDFSKITLNKYQVEFSEEELEEMANKTLKEKLNYIEQDSIYLANYGDVVIIDYSGSIDGNSFEGSEGEDYRLELGSKTFVANFEEQLVGKMSGETVNVNVTFPADYFRPSLANKNAVFVVDIISILKTENVKIDNEFIQKTTGSEDMEDLKDAIFDEANVNYSATCRAIFKKELFDYLDSFYKIELPVGLVNEQSKFLKNIVESSGQNSGNPDVSSEDKLKSLKLSQRMVRCGLILADIASKNDIQVTNEEVDEEIDNIIAQYPEQEAQILETYNKNPQAIQQIQGAILEEKTIDFILQKININEMRVSSKQIDRLWFDISNNQ